MSGIQVCTSDGNFTSSGIGLLCSADMPARALISNMKAFNGSYACSTCEVEGATVPGNTLHRIWPFSDSNTLRTQDRMYSAIVTSVQQGQPVSLGASLVCVASNYSVSFESLFSLASLGVKFMYCNIYLLQPYTQLQVVHACVRDAVCTFLFLRNNLAYFVLVKVKDNYIGLHNYHSDSRMQGISCFGRSSTFSCHKWHGHRLHALCSTWRWRRLY